MLLFWLQITIAKKPSECMGGFKALKAASLPTCNLSKFVELPLKDNSMPIHMIVTTPDRFDTCYLIQVRIPTMPQTLPRRLALLMSSILCAIVFCLGKSCNFLLVQSYTDSGIHTL